MPRKPRASSATDTYHVVIRGADRQVMFEEEKDYQKYLEILEYYKEECHFDIFAYCLMSNHVHLLIHINDFTLSSVFRKINTSYAIWFNMKYQRTGFLQQGRFYSEPVIDLRYLMNVTCYIHHNPTAAGLEKAYGDSYKWSSIYAYKNADSSLVDIDFLLEMFQGRETFFEIHDLYDVKNSNCLDISNIRKRLPDDVARDIIYEISKCRTAAEFQTLHMLQQKSFVSMIHNKGVSVRQINRLTGMPKGKVERILQGN